MDGWKNQLSTLSSGLNVNVTSLNDARLKLAQQVKSTAKTIASEFQETAKELRDAHTEFGGRLAVANAGREEEVRFAFPAELDGGAGGEAVRVAAGEIGKGEGTADDGGRRENVPDHGVSERLAALKEKLQQKRSVSSSRNAMKDEGGLVRNGDTTLLEAAPATVPASIIPPIVTGQVEDGGRSHSRELDRRQQETIDRLRIEMEQEVGKNEHLLGLYEDAEANARKAEARAVLLEEEVRKLKETSNALVKSERMAREEAERVREGAEGAGAGRVSVQQQELSRPSPSADLESKEIQSLKEQLDKLKMQMLATQTAFEEQIEAEVQERVSALAQGTSSNPSRARREEDEQLLADLEIALDKIQEAEKESAHWKSEAERMRDEMANLQIALDELRYESENGEKLRVQVRAAQADVRAMEEQVAEALASKDAFERKAKEAGVKAEEERRRAFAAREAEGVAKQELITMQVAFSEMSKELDEREGGRGAMERETVVEVLKEMSNMRHGAAMKHGVDRLGLTEAERRAVLGDGSGLASTFVAFLETSVVEE